MDFITYQGVDYLHIDSAAKALGVSTATIRNKEKIGQITLERPLGPALTFVSRQAVEKLMRLKITPAMDSFIRSKGASCGT